MKAEVLEVKGSVDGTWGRENKPKKSFAVVATINGVQEDCVFEVLSKKNFNSVTAGAAVTLDDKEPFHRKDGRNSYTVSYKQDDGGYTKKKGSDSVGMTVGNAITNAAQLIASQISSGNSSLSDIDEIASEVGALAELICIEAVKLHEWGNAGFKAKTTDPKPDPKPQAEQEDDLPF